MLLKNENEINNNICQSVLEYAKHNKKETVFYFLNDREILFRRKLGAVELENKERNDFFESRKQYVNAFGVISSTIKIENVKSYVVVDFNVVDRSESKTKISWEYAEAINTITNKQYLKEDFRTIKNFAKVANLKAAFVSKMRTACTFRRMNRNNPEIQKLDVYQAVILNSLGIELDAFVEALGGYEAIRQMPYRELEKEATSFKEPFWFAI